jgi:hypothetical protein
MLNLELRANSGKRGKPRYPERLCDRFLLT